MSPLRRRRRQTPEDTPPPLSGFAQVDFHLDLHGMRVEPALLAVERHLEACYGARLPLAHINHGRGTSVLRDAVQERLHRHRLVKRHYYAGHSAGGDGVTIAELNYGDRGQLRRRADAGRPAGSS